MTVCRLQTAQTDDRTQFGIYFSVLNSVGIMCNKGQKTIIIIVIIIIVMFLWCHAVIAAELLECRDFHFVVRYRD